MIKIRNLLGHGQVNVACHCLGSLLKYCRDPLKLIIHDDGTLTSDDLERLTNHLDEPEFVLRAFADEYVAPHLEPFPAGQKYRKNHALALKLFDISLMNAPDEPLYFCDSDILFFRSFRFPTAISKDTMIFMQDTHQSFSLRPWHIKPIGKMKILSQINTGLIITHPSNVDFGYVESLLTDPKFEVALRNRPHWIEQTCWAGMAARLPTYFFDPHQITIASDKMGAVTAQQIATHFVSGCRYKLEEYVNIRVENDEKEQVLLLNRAKNATSFDLFWSDFARKFNFTP